MGVGLAACLARASRQQLVRPVADHPGVVEAGRAGGTAPAVYNAGNEVAVAAFLSGEIPFGRIAETIERVLDQHRVVPVDDLETVRAVDQWARERAREAMA